MFSTVLNTPLVYNKWVSLTSKEALERLEKTRKIRNGDMYLIQSTSTKEIARINSLRQTFFVNLDSKWDQVYK